jgi:hypothetical protein
VWKNRRKIFINVFISKLTISKALFWNIAEYKLFSQCHHITSSQWKMAVEFTKEKVGSSVQIFQMRP